MAFRARPGRDGFTPAQQRSLYELELELQKVLTAVALGVTAPSGSDVRASVGQLVRVAPNGGNTPTVLLPAATTANAGLEIYVTLERLGSFRAIAADGLVNGQGSVTFGSLGLYVIKSDGKSGWWASTFGLANMPAGTQKGRQIDAGTGAPVDLTGAEQGENIRFGTVQTDSASGAGTITLNSDTTVLETTGGGGTRTIQGITGGVNGRMLFLRHTAGGATLTQLNMDDAAASAADRIRCQDLTTHTYGNSATGTFGGLLIYLGNRWHLIINGFIRDAAQITAILDLFTSTLKGLVPASGGGTANFLRADGVWATPAPTLSHWNNYSPEVSAVLGATADSLWLFPLPYDQAFPGVMTLNTMNLGLSCNVASTGTSAAFTFRAGLYTLNNSTQLSLLNSVSSTFSTTATANLTLQMQGVKDVTFHSSQWSAQPVLSEGHYWMGVVMSTAGNPQIAKSFQAASVGRSAVAGVFGNSVTAGQKHYPFHGAVSTAGIPNAVAASAVIGTHSYAHMIPALQFRNGVQTA